MSPILRYKLLWELCWWVFTAVVVLAVVYPVAQLFTTFEYLWVNVLYVVLFITFTRYIFGLRHTWLAFVWYPKIAMVLLAPALVFVCITQLREFQAFLDVEGLYAFEKLMRQDVPLPTRERTLEYVRSEILFFGVGSIVAGAMLPFRLLISLWRNHNKGTV